MLPFIAYRVNQIVTLNWRYLDSGCEPRFIGLDWMPNPIVEIGVVPGFLLVIGTIIELSPTLECPSEVKYLSSTLDISGKNGFK